MSPPDMAPQAPPPEDGGVTHYGTPGGIVFCGMQSASITSDWSKVTCQKCLSKNRRMAALFGFRSRNNGSGV